jgi:hypothetical protein
VRTRTQYCATPSEGGTGTERTQTHVPRDAVRVCLSAHSARLSLVLQAEQQRPAFDEVHPPSPSTSVCPVVPVLGTTIRRYWAKYSSYGGARWSFPAQIRFQPRRRRHCGIVRRKLFFGLWEWRGGGGVAGIARVVCCMTAPFSVAAPIVPPITARHRPRVIFGHSWHCWRLDVACRLLHVQRGMFHATCALHAATWRARSGIRKLRTHARAQRATCNRSCRYGRGRCRLSGAHP